MRGSPAPTSVTLRAVKGSELDLGEFDGNFSALKAKVDLLSSDVTWQAPVHVGTLRLWQDTLGSLRVKAGSNPTGAEDGSLLPHSGRERGRRGYSFFTDFMAANPPELGLAASGTGATHTINPGGQTAIGVIYLTTGTTATGRCSMMTSPHAFILGGGVWTYECPAFFWPEAPTPTENGYVRLGFHDDTTGLNPQDGVFFYLDGNDDRWKAVAMSNGVATTVQTGVVVGGASVTQYFKIVVDRTVDAKFYINNNLVATITTNLPTGAGRYVGYGTTINKTAGTAQRTIYHDWLAVDLVLTAARFT